MVGGDLVAVEESAFGAVGRVWFWDFWGVVGVHDFPPFESP
jgi:hypothetical protein